MTIPPSRAAALNKLRLAYVSDGNSSLRPQSTCNGSLRYRDSTPCIFGGRGGGVDVIRGLGNFGNKEVDGLVLIVFSRQFWRWGKDE